MKNNDLATNLLGHFKVLLRLYRINGPIKASEHEDMRCGHALPQPQLPANVPIADVLRAAVPVAARPESVFERRKFHRATHLQIARY